MKVYVYEWVQLCVYGDPGLVSHLEKESMFARDLLLKKTSIGDIFKDAVCS